MPPDRRERLVAVGGGAICALAVIGVLGRVGDHQSLGTTLALARASQPVAARPPTTPAPSVRLRITLWPRGPGHRARTWQVACPPQSGACRVAVGRLALLQAGEAHAPCAATAGGMREASLVGVVRGHPVAAWLDQRDPCDAAAWATLQGLLNPSSARATPASP